MVYRCMYALYLVCITWYKCINICIYILENMFIKRTVKLTRLWSGSI